MLVFSGRRLISSMKCSLAGSICSPCHGAWLLLLCSAFLPQSRAEGQSAAAGTGTVTGHVICSDTQGPARMAHVVLQPVPDGKTTSPAKPKDEPRSENVALTPTGLDGSFAVSHVQPGTYYVIAEQGGYLSPLTQFSREEMTHPDAATQVQMSRLLRTVTVTAGHIAQAEVTLVRGGAISGTVHFDDGSPAIHVPVALMHKGKDGKWTEMRVKGLADGWGDLSSDDRGAYHLPGLPAGDYLVKATLTRDNISLDHVFAGEGGSMMMGDGYNLAFFQGDVTRPKDAKPIHVDEGVDAEGNDIDLPVSKLYAVSGGVVQAGTAHTINAAQLALVYADDDTELAKTQVSKDDDQFHFAFVPAGNFVLKATNVREVSRTEVPSCEHCFPPTHTDEKLVRSFADASQPLMVQTDMEGVVVNATVRAKLAHRRPALSEVVLVGRRASRVRRLG